MLTFSQLPYQCSAKYISLESLTHHAECHPSLQKLGEVTSFSSFVEIQCLGDCHRFVSLPWFSFNLISMFERTLITKFAISFFDNGSTQAKDVHTFLYESIDLSSSTVCQSSQFLFPLHLNLPLAAAAPAADFFKLSSFSRGKKASHDVFVRGTGLPLSLTLKSS